MSKNSEKNESGSDAAREGSSMPPEGDETFNISLPRDLVSEWHDRADQNAGLKREATLLRRIVKEQGEKLEKLQDVSVENVRLMEREKHLREGLTKNKVLSLLGALCLAIGCSIAGSRIGSGKSPGLTEVVFVVLGFVLECVVVSFRGKRKG